MISIKTNTKSSKEKKPHAKKNKNDTKMEDFNQQIIQSKTNTPTMENNLHNV